jgi:hypothetical protein
MDRLSVVQGQDSTPCVCSLAAAAPSVQNLYSMGTGSNLSIEVVGMSRYLRITICIVIRNEAINVH